jgi:hypothetical protein
MRVRLAISFILAFVMTINPATAAERACRQSLSNFYHCPDGKSPSPQPTTSPSSRTCIIRVSQTFGRVQTTRRPKRRSLLEPVGRAFQMVIRVR